MHIDVCVCVCFTLICLFIFIFYILKMWRLFKFAYMSCSDCPCTLGVLSPLSIRGRHTSLTAAANSKHIISGSVREKSVTPTWISWFFSCTVTLFNEAVLPSYFKYSHSYMPSKCTYVSWNLVLFNYFTTTVLS